MGRPTLSIRNWSVLDVMVEYSCTETQAVEILNKSLNSEVVIKEIQDEIARNAQSPSYNLKRKHGQREV